MALHGCNGVKQNENPNDFCYAFVNWLHEFVGQRTTYNIQCTMQCIFMQCNAMRCSAMVWHGMA